MPLRLPSRPRPNPVGDAAGFVDQLDAFGFEFGADAVGFAVVLVGFGGLAGFDQGVDALAVISASASGFGAGLSAQSQHAGKFLQ